MFVVPFLGLSILVHISIIIFFNVFHITPSNWRKIRHRKKFDTFWGSLIILSIFGFAFISAASLIRLSATEKHSTIDLIENNQVPLEHFADAIYLQTIGIRPLLAQ
jgi:uncharacterized membrane protein